MLRRFVRWLFRHFRPHNKTTFLAPRTRLRFEPLESIVVPASVLWDGDAGTLNWNDAANWSGDVKPTAADDVFINQTGLTILYNTGTSVVKSVTTSSAINIDNGTLEINGDLQMNGASSFLAGGTLRNAVIKASGGATFQLSNQGGTLNAVTISAGTVVDGTTAWPSYPSNENTAAVRGGLTVNGVINLGNVAGSSWGGLWFDETQTLGGTGKIVFGGSANNRLVSRYNNTTLTLAAGFTIEGQKGKIDQDYGYQATERIVNNATINIASGGSLWFSADNWVNNGTITVPNGNLTLGGSFTTTAIGNLNATGSEVYLTGVVSNANSTLTLKPEWGNWILWNGTIDGGVLTQTGYAKLRLSNQGGRLQGGLTLASGFVLDGTTAWPNYPANENSAAVNGGLIINGTVNLGAATGSAWGGLWFDGTQTVGGTGQIVFGPQASNGLFARGNGTTVTLGSGLQIRGGYANIYGAGSYNSVELIDNASNLTITGNGRFNFQNLTLSDAYTLDVAANGKLGLRGDLLATMQTGNRFAQRGTVLFYGSGTAANPQRLEVISQNNGGAPTNFASNFSFNTIQLQNNTRVQLVDLVDNMAGAGAEALYADTIIVPAGSTLDLNGIAVYARITQIAGTVLNGSITVVPDGGGFAAGIPASGKISLAGQTDDWSIPVIAGQTLLVQLNSGDGTNVPPAAPVLSRGGFDILDPQGNVIATQNATTNGQFLSARLNLLPISGNYTHPRAGLVELAQRDGQLSDHCTRRVHRHGAVALGPSTYGPNRVGSGA